MERLLKQLGLDSLPEDQKQEFTAKIDKLLQDRILLRITAELTDEQAAQAETMPPEQFFENLAQFGVDMPKIAQEEALRLREELTSNMAYMQGYIEGQEEKD